MKPLVIIRKSEGSMSKQNIPMHYVCTWAEAEKIINKHKRFWVVNCRCREGRKKCKRSAPVDICLLFRNTREYGDSNFKEITRTKMNKIFSEVKEKYLITRPFRNLKTMTTDGICFCCDDCCGYFPTNKGSGKGKFIEKTDKNACKNCGTCVKFCYFGARQIKNKKLTINQKSCYGCGFCVDVCPGDCIQMTYRK